MVIFIVKDADKLLERMNNRNDLISRDSARRIIESPRNKEQMLMALASLSSVYLKPNKGHWIRDTSHGFGVFNWKCSKCGHIIVATTPDRYCGACGCDNNIQRIKNDKRFR